MAVQNAGTYPVLHVAYADCGENDGDDWIVVPSWTETDDKADEHGRNIMSHLTAAKRTLDDVSGRLTALKKSSGGVKTGCELASTTCDADVAVSRNW